MNHPEVTASMLLRSQGKSFLAERNEEAVNENLNMKALPPYWPTFERDFLLISGFCPPASLSCIMESLSLFTRLRFGGRWYAFYGFTTSMFFFCTLHCIKLDRLITKLNGSDLVG